ncbi:MAG: hypothetical protein KC731_30550 [Myxococcales bacterium]|nr:hypothetical protein [Myxococcales bacterium]
MVWFAMARRSAVLALCGSWLTGCNAIFGVGDLSFDGSGGSPSAGGGGVAPSVGGAGGSGGAGGGGGGGGGGVVIDCSGAFGMPELVVDSNDSLSSPSITGDELAIYYLRSLSNGSEVVRASRAEAMGAFVEDVVVQELTNACLGFGPLTGMDVTPDESAAYLSCGEPLSPDAQVVRYRAEGDLWQLDEVIGAMGTSPAIRDDGLVLYAATDDPVVATRRSVLEPFGAPQVVPGLENSGLTTPGPSPDGLELFGTMTVMGVGTRLGVATRPDPGAPFGMPEPVDVPEVAGTTLTGSGDVSADCRRLYYVGVVAMGGGTSQSGIYVIER